LPLDSVASSLVYKHTRRFLRLVQKQMEKTGGKKRTHEVFLLRRRLRLRSRVVRVPSVAPSSQSFPFAFGQRCFVAQCAARLIMPFLQASPF